MYQILQNNSCALNFLIHVHVVHVHFRYIQIYRRQELMISATICLAVTINTRLF